METIRVLFRIDRNRDPDSLTAVLPDVPSNYGRCLCYAHIGQHGECSRDWYYTTRPAKPEEYAELLKELRGIYENIGAPDDIAVTLKVATRTKHEDWVKRPEELFQFKS